MTSTASMINQAQKIIDEQIEAEADTQFTRPYIVIFAGQSPSQACDAAGWDYFDAATEPEMRWVSFHDEIPEDEAEYAFGGRAVMLPTKAHILFRPKRTKVLEGGRGSAKSRSVATALVLRAAERPTRTLCTRELQHSISESVHKLLDDTVGRLGYSEHFTVIKTHIRCRNGSEFLFSGIKNNVNKIKSMENVDVCWCEEAEAITDASWLILTPTIRAPGSEIWVVFNAYDENDATYTKFITHCRDVLDSVGSYEDEETAVVRMNYVDNPWFPYELRLEMEKMEREHYRDYLHVWEGLPVGASDEAIIDPLWVRAAVDAHIKLGFKARGVKSIGFDPADGGADSKAYCIRHGSVVTHCKSWYDGDITDAIETVFETAKELGATDMVYDGVGVGAAVKHHINLIQGRDSFEITAFLGNDTPEDPLELYKDDRAMADVFRNLRAQKIWFLRDRFEKTYQAVEKGMYIDPDELISLSSDMEGLSTLKSELSRVERKRGAAFNNLIQVESKADMKARGLKSPGLFDSLYYAFSNKPLPDSWGKPIDYSKETRA